MPSISEALGETGDALGRRDSWMSVSADGSASRRPRIPRPMPSRRPERTPLAANRWTSDRPV